MGTGAFANLRSAADYDRLGAVVISHMHADHFLDIIPLRYALCYGPKRPKRRMPLWLPPGGAATLKRLCSAFADEGGDFLNDVFDVNEYDPSATLRLGSGTLNFAPTSHYIPAFAVRWSNGRASVTYSADTAPDARVSELARGCGLFLCEATLLHDEGEPGVRGHSSAGEAARMARDADARHLVLTHYGDRTKPEDLAGAARGVYDGPVAVADDGSVFELVD